MSIPSPAAQRSPDVRTGAFMIVLGACFLMVMMDNTILNVALETVQRELHANTSQLQWAVDAYILVYAALMFTAGVVADRYGRRKTLIIGLILFAVASAFASQADTPNQLIVWRGLMGIGGAVVPPTTLAMIKDSIPKERQGVAMGVWSAIGGLSVAFGPILGGALLDRFWWGSVFLVNVPLAIGCAVLLLVVAPETRSPTRVRPDLPGLSLSMATIGALVYGVIRAGESGDWLQPTVIVPIVGGLALAAFLVLVEKRTAQPALDVTLFQRRAFTAGTAAISSAFFALTGGTFLIVFYVQLVRGDSPLQLGVILLPVAVGSVATAVTSATVVRRLGYRVAIATGIILLVIALAGMLFVTRTSSIYVLEASLFVAGLGMGLTMGATTTLVMSAVDAERAGVGSAVNNTLRQVGAALGVAALGSILTTRYRNIVDPLLAEVPGHIRAEASDSLGATLMLLHNPEPQLGAERTAAAVQQAQDAFVRSMHTTLWVAIGLLAVTAVLVLMWAPTTVTRFRASPRSRRR